MENINMQEIEDLIKLGLSLEAKKDVLLNERDDIEIKVKAAKEWVAKQPEYLKFLQHLQVLLHERNIGIFSELLSYLVKDILNKEKEIVLNLYTYHNLPALKIEASNQGMKEDIYSGNGGSIANIVSTGLRLIALSRLKNHRQFIILDEPDCWLKPTHVPLFAKIIGELAKKLNIQTIIISHHSWEYFKDYGRVIELKSDGKNLYTEIIHDTEYEEKGLDPERIEEILLKDFMSHHQTSFRLHPHLTCLIGENDIGKSVLATATKSVAYNDSSDSYIKHHTNESQVLFRLKHGVDIFWQRFLETTQENPQKVKYSLFKNKILQHAEFESNHTPNFIEKELKIMVTEDIDLQIGSQKEPVFLLGNNVKPNQRAKILSLGKESLIAQKTMELLKSKARDNKQTIRDGEIRYDSISKELLALGHIQYTNIALNDIKKDIEKIQKNEDILKNLQQDTNKIHLLVKSSEIELLKENISLGDLKPTQNLERVLSQLHYVFEISKMDSIAHHFNFVELKDVNSLYKEIKILQKLEKAAKLKKCQEKQLEVQPLYDVQSLEKIIQKMKVNIPKVIDTKELQSIQKNDLHKEKDLKDLKRKILFFKAFEHNQLQMIQDKEFHQDLHNISELNNMIKKIKELSQDVKKWQNHEKMINEKMIQFKEKEASIIQQHPTCPTCQQNLPDNFSFTKLM